MVARRRRAGLGPAAAAVAAFGLLLAAPLQASAQEDPLADANLLEGLTHDDLAAAAPARRACRGLADLVNTSVARWDEVREGKLDRTAYRRLRNNQARQWAVGRGDCAAALLRVSEGSPRLVLDHEVELLTDTWDALREVGRRWLAEQPPEAVTSAAAEYASSASRYADHVDRARSFWEGRGLPTDRPKTCVDDLDAALSDLGGAVRVAFASPIIEGADPTARLAPRWEALDRSRLDCRPGADQAAERVRLSLLGELLTLQQQLIAGLSEGGDLRELLTQEQALTSRLARCVAEHDRGEVSSWCQAP